MRKVWLTGAILISTLLPGCGSTPEPMVLSKGGQLLLETKIQSEREIRKLLENIKEQNANPQNVVQKRSFDMDGMTDVVFGSGLVSSMAVLSDTGQWVSAGSFTNWSQLGLGLVTWLASSDMTRHPLTYTYFFNQDANCDDLECTEDAIAAYFKDVSDVYFATVQGAQYEADEVNILRSNFILDRVTLEHNYKVPEGERDGDWKIMSVVKLDKVNKKMHLWGNYNPREMPDHVGFRNMNYIDTSNMLIEVSKRHPTVLIYRGIDTGAAKQNRPCYGGYFIKNGEPIVVEELKCVKMAGS